jgi:hypothetical protein
MRKLISLEEALIFSFRLARKEEKYLNLLISQLDWLSYSKENIRNIKGLFNLGNSKYICLNYNFNFNEKLAI